MALPISVWNNDRILIIAPHPDDECIGVGGILTQYADICEVIVMTDGRYGGDNTLSVEECIIRKQQFKNEMEYLGIRCYKWLGYEDGNLLNNKQCMDNIDFSRYTKVFLPWGDDNHSDHMAAFVYAIERIRRQKIENIEIYQYEVHVPFHDITDYLDITSCIEEKMRLIQFHVEQVRGRAYDMIAKALGKYRACQMNQPNKYYEVYVKTEISNAFLENAFVYRERLLQKYKQFYRILLNWINSNVEGKSICKYLEKRGIQRVAIYGYADIGKALSRELVQNGIVISSILDKRVLNCEIEGMEICNPADGDRSVDAVLVTVAQEYDGIRDVLEKLGYSNIFWVLEIVEELGKK